MTGHKDISHALQIMICNELNVDLSKNVMEGAYRVSSSWSFLLKHFQDTCIQTTNTWRRNTKNAYLQELGYFFLTKSTKSSEIAKQDVKKQNESERRFLNIIEMDITESVICSCW